MDGVYVMLMGTTIACAVATIKVFNKQKKVKKGKVIIHYHDLRNIHVPGIVHIKLCNRKIR